MSQTPASPDVPDDVRADRYRSWTDKDMAAQCRMQARENLDPDYSGFMHALAERLADRASRALPSTALAARPEEGWRPIETAPKDGSDLVCLAPEYNGHIILFWWAEHDSWFDYDGDRYNPTHWHPLAPYPSTPPTAGDGHD